MQWLKYLTDVGPLAEEYTHSHGRKVGDVMTRDVVTVTGDTALDEVVRRMERHRIKRVPVLRGGEVVGMVSRSNILHAFIVLSPNPDAASVSDAEIRRQIETELGKQAWAQQSVIDVQVNDGIVDLSGDILDQRQRAALRVAAENVPGVRQVSDHLLLKEPATS